MGWSHGDVLFWKVHLPLPRTSAILSQRSGYQVVYYPYEDRIIHAYALWREGSYGAGFTTESEAVQRITLNNLADWDRETETLCLECLNEAAVLDGNRPGADTKCQCQKNRADPTGPPSSPRGTGEDGLAGRWR